MVVRMGPKVGPVNQLVHDMRLVLAYDGNLHRYHIADKVGELWSHTLVSILTPALELYHVDVSDNRPLPGCKNVEAID